MILVNFRRRCDSRSDMREFTDNSIQQRSCDICIKHIEAYAPERSSIYRFDVYANGGRDGERFCRVRRCAPPIPNSARGFHAINSRFRRRLATVPARPICSSCSSRDCNILPVAQIARATTRRNVAQKQIICLSL